MSKKILFINTLYTPYILGGAEIVFQKQVEGLKQRGYDVCVLTTGNEKGLKLDYINDIKVYRAEIKNIYWHYKNFKSNNKFKKLIWHFKDSYNSLMKIYINNVLKLEKPDLVISHNLAGFSISVWDAVKSHKIPIIQVLHDMYMLCSKSIMFNNNHTCQKQCAICKILRYKHKIKSEEVDVLVGVSNFIINKMNEFEYFKYVKKQVIYNAQNIKFIENKILWDGKRTLKIGFLGTLSQSKGIEWLINQFNQLNIDAELTIGGRGDENYEKYLKELSNNNSKIKFLGYVNSQVFYSQIDIICMPSLWSDTFPGVAYEASANNIPVIATNMGGLPEIIINHKNGLIINPIDENSLKHAILNLFNNPQLYKELALNSRKIVQNFLNENRMLDEYEKLIENL